MNKTIKYRECLETLESYKYNPDDDPDYGIDWMRLWAQSRLNDMGKAY
jgi:hypothetical protein